MRHDSSIRHPIALAILLLTLPYGAPATAAECPVDGELSRDDVTGAALKVFEAGPGRAFDERIAGAEAAREAVPDRVTALEGSVAPEFHTGGRGEINEYSAPFN